MTMSNKVMDYRRPESVLVLVYSQHSEVLLLHRVGPSPYWQSVTGSLHWGETKLAAAERELFEETGIQGLPLIDCQQSASFKIYPERLSEYAPGTVWNREFVFRVELEATCEVCLNSKEHTEYQWLPLSEAVNQVRSSSNRDALLGLMKLISGRS